MEVKWCCKFLFLFFGVASCYSRVEILQNAVLQFKAVADRVYFLEAFSLFLSSSFIVAPAKVRYSGKKKKKAKVRVCNKFISGVDITNMNCISH